MTEEIKIITDIQTYDGIKNKDNCTKELILSFDPEFKKKVVLFKPVSTIFLGFKENNFEDVIDWNSYMTFFLTLLRDVTTVYIDTKSYSTGFQMLQSCAINSSTVKEIKIYVDSDDKENYKLVQDPNSPNYKKELTCTCTW